MGRCARVRRGALCARDASRCAPQIERAIPGHGCEKQRTPSRPLPSSGVPEVGSTTAGLTPNIGNEAAPGFIGVHPGRLVTMWPPVSVCQNVSTTTQFFLPTSSKYHRHASGLIGSPTVPRTRSDERSYFLIGSVPNFISARIAVGA